MEQRRRGGRCNSHHEQKREEDDRRVVERQDQPQAHRQAEAAEAGEIDQRLRLPGTYSGFFLAQRRENDLFAVHGIMESRRDDWPSSVSLVRTVVCLSRARTFTALELNRVLR